jgi:hypothetical protein
MASLVTQISHRSDPSFTCGLTLTRRHMNQTLSLRSEWPCGWITMVRLPNDDVYFAAMLRCYLLIVTPKKISVVGLDLFVTVQNVPVLFERWLNSYSQRMFFHRNVALRVFHIHIFVIFCCFSHCHVRHLNHVNCKQRSLRSTTTKSLLPLIRLGTINFLI